MLKLMEWNAYKLNVYKTYINILNANFLQYKELCSAWDQIFSVCW